ncbi:hypothetical protein ACPUEN_00920 [Algoriphagus yeomjeoni]|uniref:hypothetical protein n=1 Tax=Algoriphagus yeomjeoni TaxID=291403 RepID=UPI003CE5A1F0
MIVKLNRNQYDYLDYSLSEQQPDLKLKLQNRKEDKFVFVEVDEDVADEIRDWAGEELQKKGFDLDYELTSEGKILEELIDAFYVE